MEPPPDPLMPVRGNGASPTARTISFSGSERLTEEEVAAHPDMLMARLRVGEILDRALSQVGPVVSEEAQRLRLLGFAPGDVSANLVEPFSARGIFANEIAERPIASGLNAKSPLLAPSPSAISAITIAEFLSREFPPRQTMLSPWLPRAGIAMIHAPRGVGKTHVALGIARAVAEGSSFLRWNTPAGPFRVLLLDGEMPAVLLQARLRRVVSANRIELPSPDYLRIAAADLLRDGLPDLADPAAQGFYADIIASADLVIVDNLSTLCRALRENEADTWGPVQAWCLAQRRQNKSVLLIHHSGKNGSQRGTSKKEDVLDTVIGLRRPLDYQADEGARFELHFEKARGFFGPDAEAFEAHLIADRWQESPIKSGDDIDTMKKLKGAGMSVREISERTGVPRSTVHRKLDS